VFPEARSWLSIGTQAPSGFLLNLERLDRMKLNLQGKDIPQISSFLEKIVQETQQSEPEIIAQAFQVGLKQLWREPVLGSYLKGEVTREAAIEKAGIDWVELAEHQC
tara:strand:+ start:572 stop:892 length:321 start_codon:yes stop_codon:yes gene_type:complete